MAGLYLHMPFCFHKCWYCDFYSIVPDGPGRWEGFLERLVEELRWQAGQVNLRPRTVFAGGGTPTFMPAGLWGDLLDALSAAGVLDRVEEFTVEANPETVTRELVSALAGGGVNRISVGCQSFQPRLLSALERWHDPDSVERAVGLARGAGIDNVSLDLIFAIPGQTMSDLDHDLDAALALEPWHLSCYGLTYEPNTPLAKLVGKGRVRPADEATERAMLERIMQRLEAAGFEHYEISNWAKRKGAEGGASTHRCLHNVLYWENADWLGAGPSAASHVAGHRWRNDPHLGRWMARRPEPPTIDHERLDPDRAAGERLMVSLRLRDGVPLDWFEKHVAPTDPRRGAIDEMIAHGLLERTDAMLRVTCDGLFIFDSIVERLL